MITVAVMLQVADNKGGAFLETLVIYSNELLHKYSNRKLIFMLQNVLIKVKLN